MALRGQAGQANTSASTSATVTVSGIGIVSGDIVIFLMNSNSATLTAPAGFTAVTGISQTANNNTQIMAWYKVAGGSEPTTYTATANTSDFQTAQVCVFSGRNTSSPFDYTATQASAIHVSPAAISFTGFTPAQSGDDLLVFAGTDNTATVYTAPVIAMSSPAGFANSLVSYGSVNYSPVASVISNQAIGASATGTIAGTQTWASGPATWYMAAFLIALSPASGGGGISLAWIT